MAHDQEYQQTTPDFCKQMLDTHPQDHMTRDDQQNRSLDKEQIWNFIYQEIRKRKQSLIRCTKRKTHDNTIRQTIDWHPQRQSNGKTKKNLEKRRKNVAEAKTAGWSQDDLKRSRYFEKMQRQPLVPIEKMGNQSSKSVFILHNALSLFSLGLNNYYIFVSALY